MNRETLGRGALAGMAGGAVMAMWSMVALWLTGAGFWTPLNLIANTIWHGAPVTAAFGVGAAALGLLIHMMMSMALGIMLAVAVRAFPRLAGGRITLAMTGMAFGLAVWAVTQYWLWPAIDAAAAAGFTPWVFAIGHLMFGAVTALAVGAALARRPVAARWSEGIPA